jgi:hypothetical protein
VSLMLMPEPARPSSPGSSNSRAVFGVKLSRAATASPVLAFARACRGQTAAGYFTHMAAHMHGAILTRTNTTPGTVFTHHPSGLGCQAKTHQLQRPLTSIYLPRQTKAMMSALLSK